MNKEDLEQKINEGYNQRMMCEHFGKSGHAIRYWLDKHGLAKKYRACASYGRLNNLSLEKYKEIVKSSVCTREVLEKLNLKACGGNYATFRKFIKKHNIDTSHFTGQRWSKGKALGTKYPIEDYLSNKRYILSHTLKLRLIAEGLFEHKCYKCNLDKWLGQPIAIELEHIDGNHSNNNLNNLTILCPNCHAQTSTYRGKNKKIVKSSGS